MIPLDDPTSRSLDCPIAACHLMHYVVLIAAQRNCESLTEMVQYVAVTELL
jgi:hypothetical protein